MEEPEDVAGGGSDARPQLLATATGGRNQDTRAPLTGALHRAVSAPAINDYYFTIGGQAGEQVRDAVLFV